MPRFLLRRAAAVPLVLLAVATITWLMLHVLYPEPWAFDTRPFLVQFGSFLWDTVRLDLGTSWDQRQATVTSMLADGLPVDLWLLGGAMVVGVTGGLLAGAWCAARPRSPLAWLFDGFAAFGLVAPVYWVGFTLLLLFASGYGVVALPFAQTNVYVGPTEDPVRFLEAMWMPWLVLAIPLAALVQRMTRAAMTETLRSDFIRTAQAKGLGERAVARRHALPAAASPVMTLVGTQMATLMANLVLVEIVFGLPGVYEDVRRATENGNLPLLQGVTLVTALLVVLATLVVDLLQAWLDPTVREA